MPKNSIICDKIAQLRRCPKHDKNGSFTLSTNGAHAHLKLNGVLMSDSAPMVAKAIPLSLSHRVNVPTTSANGKPLEKPSVNMATCRRSW